MAQPAFRPVPNNLSLLSLQAGLATKLLKESQLLADFSEYDDLKSLMAGWRHTNREDTFRNIKTALQDVYGIREQRHEPGEVEALLAHPKGPEYRFRDNLTSHEGKIRILEILPGEHEKIIVCRIHTAFLSEDPKYEALSYCWGRDKSSCPIGIQATNTACTFANAQEAPSYDYVHILHPNLRSALRHIRLPDRSRFVWADFVCIDQKNKREKNHQVALMRKVYQKAEKTLVWLGETGSNSSQAFEKLRRIVRDDGNSQTFNTSDRLIPEDTRPVGSPAIILLLDREWFHRTWTVQELILARDAEIICGKETMPWKGFSDAVKIICERDLVPDGRISLLDEGHFENFQMLIRAEEASLPDLNHTPYEKLTNLLLMLRRRDCSHEEDKVYGISGLVCDSDDKPIIEADYHKSYQQVYAEVTRLVIQKTNQLDILSASGSMWLLNGNKQLMPSWVADFIRRERRPPRSFRFIHRKGFRTYRPGLKAGPKDIRFDAGQLILQGCFVDEIEEVAPVLEDFDRTVVKTWIDNGYAKVEETEHYVRAFKRLAHSLDERVGFNKRLAMRVLGHVLKLRTTDAISWTSFAVSNRQLATMCSWFLQCARTFSIWEDFAGLETSVASRLYVDGKDDEGSDFDVESGSITRSRQRREEYWRTITGGSLLPTSSYSSPPQRAVPPPSSSPEVRVSRDAFKHFDKILTATRMLRLQELEEHRTGSSLQFVYHVIGHYCAQPKFRKLLAHAQGRRLARTVGGNLVLVRDIAQRGDRLAFCRGARVPLVLREQADRRGFRYVCESYSHRLQGMSLKEVRWQEICIV